ncbi:KilA-N domain-containing protein [Levilactobacillus parabrevis]|uniref:KilA-N domain-containing protein n=1 Tax=Levilactobacillus parabrevis TaxID=357278 RepID=UPI0021A4604F|nr:KilA-N domain-containing protein [Levilactobacillus parabrevis]MCT4488797.1 KilA-N domain-containing protein [Levilactobacillus parabrevis]MCT4491632.1 KilA-N domain-containing protein [Levilactobacillus parabrevis]
MTNHRDTIHTYGISVSVFQKDAQTDYISLTDIAKYKNQTAPNELIRNWMRSKNTIEYLGTWEELHNSHLNTKGLTDLLTEAGSNAFILSPTKWIKETNAIGILSRPGRYGGTYAHSDIAFDFASWISPQFRLYLIKDYQQLKQNSHSHLNTEWNLNRQLAKVNYRIHTDAVKDSIVVLSSQQTQYKYATEADRLNMAIFGETAKQWKNENPNATGNIRDNASLEQLTVLTNLESFNAELLIAKVPAEERTKRLNKMAIRQLQTLLTNTDSMDKLRNLSPAETSKNPPKLN